MRHFIIKNDKFEKKVDSWFTLAVFLCIMLHRVRDNENIWFEICRGKWILRKERFLWKRKKKKAALWRNWISL